MSLLAYCYYSIQDFVNASDCYEQLSQIYPDQDQYKLYFAQSLYKCGLNAESMQICSQIETPSLQFKVIQLQAAIKYAENDINACVVLIKEMQIYEKICQKFYFRNILKNHLQMKLQVK